MKKTIYMAYGSNMHEIQMSQRCPTAILLGKSELNNYSLSVKGDADGAYATIDEEVGANIPVLLWEIGEEDERSLDLYEDYPVLYFKKNLSVVLNDRDVEAMVYIMDEAMTHHLPEMAYYKIIEEAYRKFGFDLKILEDAWKMAEEKE